MLVKRAFTRGARGVALVEIAIVLPLFLGVVLIFIWLAVMLNARAALTSAVEDGVMLAVTRANQNTLTEPLLPVIDNNWLGTGGNSFPAALQDVMCQDASDPGSTACVSKYNVCTVGQTYTTTLDKLPAQYTYMLAYINEAMRQSLGGMVKFPCNPTGPSSLAPICPSSTYSSASNLQPDDLGPGCMICAFLETDVDPPRIPQPPIDLSGYSVDQIGLMTSKMAIACSYEPDATVARPLQGLLGWVGVNTVITVGALYTADSLAAPQSFF